MSQYSEIIGSFIRNGNFPLEADYVFETEQELLDFYELPENKALLHPGLLKIVKSDENKKQALYWVVLDEDLEPTLTKLISVDNIQDIIDLEEKINKENTDNKDMLEEMKKVLEGNVEEVKLTNKLKSHPVCLTTTGEVSTSMEKVINAMPTDEKIKANEVLEINASHKIVDKLKDLYKNNKDEFTKYTKVIYYEARLIEGLPIDNPTELSNLMCDIMANK